MSKTRNDTQFCVWHTLRKLFRRCNRYQRIIRTLQHDGWHLDLSKAIEAVEGTVQMTKQGNRLLARQCRWIKVAFKVALRPFT